MDAYDLPLAADPVAADPSALFPNGCSPWWVSGQVNTILQAHPAFAAKYTGRSSLKPEAEVRSSRVITLYLGLEATRTTEFFLDAESVGGRGLSGAQGLVGLTNADVVRNPDLGPAPYVARAFIKQIVPLSRHWVSDERSPLQLHEMRPERRLEILAGRFALPDIFDLNNVGSDDHLQFMNLTAVSNAAWQYAGDSRGYTYGLALEYTDLLYSLRFAEALMPTIPNGIVLDWSLGRAHSENMEFEIRPRILLDRTTTVRLLAFDNHSNSGSYQDAIQSYLSGNTSRPLIESTRRQGRDKYGFGANVDQDVTQSLRAFTRYGWNDSRYESFEVNQNVDCGVDYAGATWRRPADKIGIALLSNGIAGNVREYLALGGRGILLGDGALRYAREKIVESYYNAHFWRGFYGALDVQRIWNPGYNQDRGPVWVMSLRLHWEL